MSEDTPGPFFQWWSGGHSYMSEDTASAVYEEVKSLYAEIAKLRAEREELRKALQQIAGWFPGMTYGGRVFDAQETARAALAEKGE